MNDQTRAVIPARVRFCGTVGKKKKQNEKEKKTMIKDRTRDRVSRDKQRRERERRRKRREEEERVQGSRVHYLPTRLGPRRRGYKGVPLRARGREITSVVCGFSYVREVTMVDPSVQGAIPLYVARAQCSFLADETMEVKEDGGEGRRRRKARRRRARRRGSFCSHLESATRRGLPLFHVSPFALPRSSLLLPFLALSLCFTFFPCARQSPRRPLVPPFRYFLVSTCLPLSLSPSISFPSPGCILFHG